MATDEAIQVHFNDRSILTPVYEVYGEVALLRHVHEINSTRPRIVSTSFQRPKLIVPAGTTQGNMVISNSHLRA